MDNIFQKLSSTAPTTSMLESKVDNLLHKLSASPTVAKLASLPETNALECKVDNILQKLSTSQIIANSGAQVASMTSASCTQSYTT